MNKKYYINMISLLTVSLIAVIAGGFYISRVAGEAASKALAAGLLTRAKILSSLIESDEIKTLSGSGADLSSEIYIKYKRMFRNACNSQEDIRYIYLIGKRGQSLFFYMDSEPDNMIDLQKPLAAPGEIYQDPPSGLSEVFDNAIDNYSTGPYTDRWGTFFSVMLPVYERDSKNIICVAGMDINAGDWNFKVFESRVRVWGVTAAIAFALLSFIYYMKSQLKMIIKIEMKLAYQQAVLKLAKCDNSDYGEALERIIKCISETLNVQQVGIWRFNEDFSALICEKIYNLDRTIFKPGDSVTALDYPRYFKELNKTRSIAASDARRDERTAEFVQNYLDVQGIVSMLDTMIWLHGRPAGVLCIEHTRTIRNWSEEEIDFALTISDFLSLVFETDERVRAEKDEKKSKLYLDKIINSIGDPVFVKDERHRFVLVNDSLCRILNRNYYEIIGRSDEDFFPMEQVEVFKKIDDLVLETGEENINEEFLTDSAGVIRCIITKKTRYQDNEGRRYIVGVIRDITEQKRMDEERIKIGKLESLGMLAGGIAHDFNNILMGILGNISLAKNRCAGEKNVYEVLQRSEVIVHKARSLTEQLITFSKGGLPIRKKCRLNDVIINTVHFTLSGSKCDAVFNISPDLNEVEIDEGQFNQVIANIVINARQACEDKGALIVNAENFVLESISEFPHRVGSYVRIAIRDEGPGIKSENMPRIFDPYFTTKSTGSGLGLFISYSIINKHNGFIRALSGPDGGAILEIYLPVGSLKNQSDDKDGMESGVKTFGVLSSTQGGAYNILVMDDDHDTLAPVCDMLTENGCCVILAETGEDALRVYEEKSKAGIKINVVIVDIVVKKGMGGAEFIKKLLAFDPDSCAIISSGRSTDELMINYAKYGFQGALAKPYKAEELYELIEKIADKKKNL